MGMEEVDFNVNDCEFFNPYAIQLSDEPEKFENETQREDQGPKEDKIDSNAADGIKANACEKPDNVIEDTEAPLEPFVSAIEEKNTKRDKPSENMGDKIHSSDFEVGRNSVDNFYTFLEEEFFEKINSRASAKQTFDASYLNVKFEDVRQFVRAYKKVKKCGQPLMAGRNYRKTPDAYNIAEKCKLFWNSSSSSYHHQKTVYPIFRISQFFSSKKWKEKSRQRAAWEWRDRPISLSRTIQTCQ